MHYVYRSKDNTNPANNLMVLAPPIAARYGCAHDRQTVTHTHTHTHTHIHTYAASKHREAMCFRLQWNPNISERDCSILCLPSPSFPPSSFMFGAHPDRFLGELALGHTHTRTHSLHTHTHYTHRDREQRWPSLSYLLSRLCSTWSL